jgi:predicted anti-sigma-YlaC factor YlaD
MLTCKEASHLISQELDGPLPLGRRILLRFHLLWCEACRQYNRQARFLREAMRRYRV